MSSFIKILFLKTIRKKSNYVTFILLPIVTTLLVSAMSFTNESPAKIGILDEDHSAISQQFVQQIKHNKKYTVYTKIEKRHIDQYLQDKSFEAVLTLDRGFGDKILHGEKQTLDLHAIADSAITEWFKAQTNYLLENYNVIGDIANGSQKKFDEITAHNATLDYNVTKVTVTDTSQSKTFSSASTGFLLILMLASMSILYSGIMLDKTSLIYNRFAVTRMTKLQYVLSYMCVGLVAFGIQIGIMFAVMKVLNVSFYVPTPIVVLTFFLYSLFAIGLGLFIGAITKNPEQSMQLSNIIVMPTSMLAGCLWPLSITPSYMQMIGKLFPQNWVLSIIEIFQNGGTFMQAAPYFVSLAILAIALIIGSSISIRPHQH